MLPGLTPGCSSESSDLGHEEEEGSLTLLSDPKHHVPAGPFLVPNLLCVLTHPWNPMVSPSVLGLETQQLPVKEVAVLLYLFMLLMEYIFQAF